MVVDVLPAGFRIARQGGHTRHFAQLPGSFALWLLPI